MGSERHLWRSMLYIPGSNARALEKARSLPTDAIIFDLEDAVAPDAKADARIALAAALTTGGYGSRARVARINALDTEWARDDLSALAGASPDGILLPKVDGAADIATLSGMMDQTDLGGTAIWAMMETPRGILNALAIADAPGMQGFVIGTNDLAKDLHLPEGTGRASMRMALQTCVLAARAAGIACVDGVYNAFKDDDGLRGECDDGRALGMDGKSLIHPAQLEIANAAFAPNETEVALARRQIAAFAEAEAAGQGVAVLDGRIVENLHVATARATLAKAEAIAETTQ